ncbi:hypothetical protein PIROE2DRAFT_6406 [Piromyces sp. E2]|nr:hypothetical protein PIROE2DRAFT_6406 [Piromyces sp. E2]|eukprot:OUM66363.1 hypothetical protein PIROE2DRAFT_6406 [Piromyces sp. E2]
MTDSKIKVAFEKIIKDKELTASLINAFLSEGDDENTTEKDIEFINEQYKNEEKIVESSFSDEKNKVIYLLIFVKEDRFEKEEFYGFSTYIGHKANFEQNVDDLNDLKRVVTIIILDGSYEESNGKLCQYYFYRDVYSKLNSDVNKKCKKLFPETFIMPIKKFKPEEYSDKDQKKMLYVWKYFFSTIKENPQNEDISELLLVNPIIRKALKVCKDGFNYEG